MCIDGVALLSQTRAKAIRKHVDKMITLAKDGSLHARRQVCLFPPPETLDHSAYAVEWEMWNFLHLPQALYCVLSGRVTCISPVGRTQ